MTKIDSREEKCRNFGDVDDRFCVPDLVCYPQQLVSTFGTFCCCANLYDFASTSITEYYVQQIIVPGLECTLGIGRYSRDSSVLKN